MSTTWLIVLVVGAATVALKGLAPVLLGDRELPAPVARVNGALAPALLAALVAVQTVGDGTALTIDPGSPASPRPPSRCCSARRCSSCSCRPPASRPRSTHWPELVPLPRPALPGGCRRPRAMEARGIEPLTPRCKRGVFPLAPRPPRAEGAATPAPMASCLRRRGKGGVAAVPGRRSFGPSAG